MLEPYGAILQVCGVLKDHQLAPKNGMVGIRSFPIGIVYFQGRLLLVSEKGYRLVKLICSLSANNAITWTLLVMCLI